MLNWWKILNMNVKLTSYFLRDTYTICICFKIIHIPLGPAILQYSYSTDDHARVFFRYPVQVSYDARRGHACHQLVQSSVLESHLFRKSRQGILRTRLLSLLDVLELPPATWKFGEVLKKLDRLRGISREHVC